MNADSTTHAKSRRTDGREMWGYLFWGMAAIVIAGPEALASGDKAPWPTISETVGNLESGHQLVALFVVALIVFCAYHAVPHLQPAPGAGGLTADHRPRTRAGRLTSERTALEVAQSELSRSEPSRTRLFVMWAIGLVAVGLGAWIGLTVNAADHFVVGYFLYGSIAIIWVIIPNILAYRYRQDVPFPPLFGTVADLEHRYHVAGVVILAGLGVLLFHIALFPWPGSIQDLIHLREANSHRCS